MSSKYKFHNPDGLYFVTFAVAGWIDLFTRETYRQIILDSFKYCQAEKGLVIHAYVIMTNHLHLIISRTGSGSLSDILRDLKKYTAYKLLGAIMENSQESRREWMLELFERFGSANSNNTKYQLWQQDNHPIELSSNAMMDQKLDYIHENPVRAGFVGEPTEYIYSSAGDYSGRKGLIDISFIE